MLGYRNIEVSVLQHFFVNKESMELKSQVKWSSNTNHLKGDSTMLYKYYTQELIGFKGATVTFAERKENGCKGSRLVL